MNDKSVVGPLLLGAALTGATGICLYLLLKKDEEFRDMRTMAARQSTLEVRIAKEASGAVIGRQGSNIREIQSKTNTRIHFKDELETDTHKVLSIKGGPEDVQLAEILIHQTIASQPRNESLVMYVPLSAVGAIIGRNGDSVRSLQRDSRCKIDVAREDEGPANGKRKITLRGSSQQIELAKWLIEEKVKEQEQNSQYGPKRSWPARVEYQEQLFLKYENEEDDMEFLDTRHVAQEELLSTGSDDFLQVYVSSVCNPSAFFVQNVGPTSVELDRLTQEMTAYYQQVENQKFHSLTEAPPGEIIVARFSGDNSFNRAKVIAFRRDEYDSLESVVELDFVDFGDFEEKKITEVFQIRQDFLRLKFQAIPCSLAHVKPPNSEAEWPAESIDEFEHLTHCSHWKPIWARIIQPKPAGGGEDSLPSIELFQSTTAGEDKNIGQELARLGLATYTTNSTPHPNTS